MKMQAFDLDAYWVVAAAASLGSLKRCCQCQLGMQEWAQRGCKPLEGFAINEFPYCALHGLSIIRFGQEAFGSLDSVDATQWGLRSLALIKVVCCRETAGTAKRGVTLGCLICCWEPNGTLMKFISGLGWVFRYNTPVWLIP